MTVAFYRMLSSVFWVDHLVFISQSSNRKWHFIFVFLYSASFLLLLLFLLLNVCITVVQQPPPTLPHSSPLPFPLVTTSQEVTFWYFRFFSSIFFWESQHFLKIPHTEIRSSDLFWVFSLPQSLEYGGIIPTLVNRLLPRFNDSNTRVKELPLLLPLRWWLRFPAHNLFSLNVSALVSTMLPGFLQHT